MSGERRFRIDAVDRACPSCGCTCGARADAEPFIRETAIATLAERHPSVPWAEKSSAYIEGAWREYRRRNPRADHVEVPPTVPPAVVEQPLPKQRRTMATLPNQPHMTEDEKARPQWAQPMPGQVARRKKETR